MKTWKSVYITGVCVVAVINTHLSVASAFVSSGRVQLHKEVEQLPSSNSLSSSARQTGIIQKRYKRNVANVAKWKSFGLTRTPESIGGYYGKRYFSAPLSGRVSPFAYRSTLSDVATEGKRTYADEPFDIDKRYFGSLLNSRTVPAFISYPYKKHIGSLHHSTKREGDEGIDEDDYYYEVDEPQESIDKRHIGSVRYMPRYQSYNKRYLGSLAGNPYFRFIHSPKRYDPQLLEYADVIEDEPNDKRPIEVSKKHISSIVQTRRPYGQPAKIYKREVDPKEEIGETHSEDDTGSNLEQKTTLDDEMYKRFYGSVLKNRANDVDKRYYGSLLKNMDNNADKRYYGSLLKNRDNEFDKRYYGSLLKNRDTDLDKRYYSSLLKNRDGDVDKRYYGSLLKNIDNDVDKRYYGSLLQNRDNDVDKRYYGSLLKNRDSDVDKRFYGSLLKSRDSDFDKRYYGSLLKNINNEVDKRYYGSLIKNRDVDLDKRHFGSLLKNRDGDFDKRYYGSLLKNIDNDADKRYYGSLLKNGDNEVDKRYYGSLLKNMDSDIDKRYYGSLLKGRDNEIDKRYYGSLLKSKDDDVDKRYYGSLLKTSTNYDDKRTDFEIDNYEDDSPFNDEEKRHLSSLRHGKRDALPEELSQLNSENGNEINEDKRHLSSLMKNTKSNDEKKHISSLIKSSSPKKEGSSSTGHSRSKRYVGALAKSNNLPFRQSRGYFGYSEPSYYKQLSLVESINNYIKDQLRKAAVREHLRNSVKTFGIPSIELAPEEVFEIKGDGDGILEEDLDEYLVPAGERNDILDSPPKRHLGYQRSLMLPVSAFKNLRHRGSYPGVRTRARSSDYSDEEY